MISNKGFTLVELIIVMGITAVIGFILVGVLVQNSGLFYIQNSRINQGVGLNDVFASFGTYVKGAKSVAANYPEVGTAVYTSGSNVLILKFDSVDSYGNLISNTYDYVVYYISQNKFYIKIYPGGGSSRQAVNKILSDNVDSVAFTYLDSANLAVSPANAAKVRIALTLRQKSGSNYETNTATSDANLRND